MADYLLELSRHRQAKALVGKLGLPLALPEVLERAGGPWTERPLAGRSVAFGSAAAGTRGTAAEAALRSMGALLASPGEGPVYGAVFDASGIADPAGLRALYDFFHPVLPRLSRSGRAIVLGAPVGGGMRKAAAQAALEGFTRSLGKELGRKGATAQLVRVAEGAENRLAGVLRFLATPHAAFVSGQVLEVTATARDEGLGHHTRMLEGKVAVVTGAARGIGAATARALAQEGGHVVVVDRPEDQAAANEVAEAIKGSTFALDVAAPDAGERLAAHLDAKFGGVDVVVQNAGITRDRTLAKMSPEAWDQVVAVNLEAVVRITERLLSGVIRAQGRIVALSSVGGIAGNFGQTNYGATKAGIVGLVRALAPEVAGRGITVNAVAPGFIETRMTAAIPFATREAGRRLSSLAQGGRPEDVAEAVRFFASPASQGVTGQVLRVCGQALIGA